MAFSALKSEHVLLALFEYDPNIMNKNGEENAVTVTLDEKGYAKGTLVVVLHMEGMNVQSFLVSEFCCDLMVNLENNPGVMIQNGNWNWSILSNTDIK
eukprot:4036479-Ditylum_brightwellii.AAC.1